MNTKLHFHSDIIVITFILQTCIFHFDQARNERHEYLVSTTIIVPTRIEKGGNSRVHQLRNDSTVLVSL